jgi:integrase
MGSVFKKQYTKPVPEGSELVERKGQRIARWRDKTGKLRTAPVTAGEDGTPRLLLESGAWYGRYRDHAGLIVEGSTGCRDEQAARQVLARWERDAERIKAGYATPAEKEMSGHQFSAIEDHFRAYDRSLMAGGASDIHRSYTARYLRRLAEECGFSRLADLQREALERWLAARAGEGMGAKTRNIYRGAVVAFCNWAVEHNRLTSNPFERVPVANVKADRRRVRRAMTEEELTGLLDVARRRPLLDAMTVRKGPRKGERYGKVRPEVRRRLETLGRERALIYKTLLLCGLRKAELTALTVASVFLDEGTPLIRLDAGEEKNREGSDLVLRDDLAADLRQWLADKLKALQDQARAAGEPIPLSLPGDTPLFEVPAGLLRIFDRDLKMAKIPKTDERGRTLDVHALRTTLSTLMNKAGVAPRTAQAAMRHSDIKLTMQTYTDPKLLDVRGALDALPALPLDGEKPCDERALATGTDDRAGRSGPARLALQLALPQCKPSQFLTNADNGTPIASAPHGDERVAVTSTPDKRNDPPSSADSGPSESGREDLNFRPHGPEARGQPPAEKPESHMGSKTLAQSGPVCKGEQTVAKIGQDSQYMEGFPVQGSMVQYGPARRGGGGPYPQALRPLQETGARRVPPAPRKVGRRHQLLPPRDHDDGERKLDVPVLAAGTEAQPVHADVVREGLSDTVGVTGVRERRGQQRIECHVEPEEGGSQVPKPRVLAEAREFFQLQGPDVGGIAEPLHLVVRLGLLGGGREHVHDGDPPARRADPHHLGQHRLGVEEVVERVPRDDHREGGVREGQGHRVPDDPRQVRQALRPLPGTGLLDHGRGQVDACDVAGDLGQRAGDQAGAARHVQHGVLRAGLGHVDEEPVGLVVGVGRHLRERHGLPRELVEDEPPLLFRPAAHDSLSQVMGPRWDICRPPGGYLALGSFISLPRSGNRSAAAGDALSRARVTPHSRKAPNARAGRRTPTAHTPAQPATAQPVAPSDDPTTPPKK